MKTTRRVLIALFATALMACAQIPDPQKTNHLRNGRGWLALNDTQRTLLIAGIFEELAAGGKITQYVSGHER